MPTGTISEIARHSYTPPRFDQAKVLDVMRLGLISCPPDISLREVARIMATYRIHSVVVTEMPDGAPLGVVSDIDVSAGAGTPDAHASTVARTELVTVSPDDPLARAAQMMAEHEVSHLVVVQPHSGHPVGILSALDIAGALAWGGAEQR
jgi:predicted transcriptional regulator